MTHPYPEEPDPHVTDPSHGGEDKVHGDGGDENIVQWENLMGGRETSTRSGQQALFQPFTRDTKLSLFIYTHNKHFSGLSVN